MPDAEYFQHVYMIIGRARKLDWVLIRNFPCAPDGEADWSVFESGPPAYLCEFLEILGQRARETWPRLLRCQTELRMPAWEEIKACAPDPEAPGRYLYEPQDWTSLAAQLCRTCLPPVALTPRSNRLPHHDRSAEGAKPSQQAPTAALTPRSNHPQRSRPSATQQMPRLAQRHLRR